MQRLASAFSLMLLFAAPVAQGMDFRPVFDGSLQQFHLLPDDRILITGRFNRVNGRHCPDLCRLNPDGSTDSGFGPVILSPNAVSSNDFGPPSMAVQPDGNIDAIFADAFGP